jgi:hypothetical protein
MFHLITSGILQFVEEWDLIFNVIFMFIYM